jgi:hypothetical protein
VADLHARRRHRVCDRPEREALILQLAHPPDRRLLLTRSTVAEALKVLEWAGVLSWQHRITRILVRERDLFGQWAARWQVIRTSNAYVFTDPQPQLSGGFPCKSENPTGTPNQEILTLPMTRTRDQNSPLERALQRLGAEIEERLLLNGSGGTVGAT